MPKPRALRHDDALRLMALASSLDMPVAALDVGVDSVTVHFVQPPAPRAEASEGLTLDEYLAQKNQDAGRERPSHRRQ